MSIRRPTRCDFFRCVALLTALLLPSLCPAPGFAAAGLLEAPAPQALQTIAAIERADFFTVLHGSAPQDSWRVYEWNAFPGIYIIHFDTYLLQGRTLNRVAMYVERAGQRGSVPTVQQLQENVEGQGLSMEAIYAAHDYRTSDLARFYNEATSAGIALFPEEQALRDWLVGSGLLIEDTARGGLRAAGRHAVLSFATRFEGGDTLGTILGQPDRAWEARALYHETRHGLYFTRPAYRQRCVEYWFTMLDGDERRALRLALAVFHYDPSDEELMVNEWMAYMLTPDYTSIGSQIFPDRLRAMASGAFRPPQFTSGDMVLLERIGPALAAKVETEMVDDLRDWLGAEWDLPPYSDVAAAGVNVGVAD